MYNDILRRTQNSTPVEMLEKAFSERSGYSEIIAVSSLYAAYTLAFSQLREGDELLCSPMSDLALYQALKQQKLHPHYLELKLDGTLESRFIERTTTSRTKVLVVSHHHGLHTEMTAFQELAQKEQLLLIEDASQAFHLTQKSSADLVLFSIEALISPSTAQGAFIATDNPEWARQLRQLREGGYVTKKLWNYDLLSTLPNTKLSTLIADFCYQALLTDLQNSKRMQEIQNLYIEGLSSLKLLQLPTAEQLMVHYHFPIFLAPALFCPKEDIFQDLLAEGVAVSVGNRPIYKTTAFLDESTFLFGAEEVYKAQVLLPVQPELSDETVYTIIEKVNSVIEKYAYRGCSF